MLDQPTLGAMIRNARLKQQWRPIDLALEMGWSGTAPVYRLERPGADTPIPTPSTINQLADVLGLDYADRMTLLGLAGHLPETEELTPAEEAHLVERLRPLMDAANEPMVLYDYQERILAVNNAVIEPFGFDSNVVMSWRAAGITGIDLLWDPGHGYRSHFRNIDDVVQSHMIRFKIDNRARRHEAWYRAYPASRAGYPGFVELWDQTDRMLDLPSFEWDVSRLIPRTNEVLGPARQILQFDASRRLVPVGNGLATLGIYMPMNDITRNWLASAS